MQDFTELGFGIRVGDGFCVVIEKKPGVRGWVEDGQRHRLPLAKGFDKAESIPTDRVVVAFKALELAHPGDGLRELLTLAPKADA